MQYVTEYSNIPIKRHSVFSGYVCLAVEFSATECHVSTPPSLTVFRKRLTTHLSIVTFHSPCKARSVTVISDSPYFYLHAYRLTNFIIQLYQYVYVETTDVKP